MTAPAPPFNPTKMYLGAGPDDRLADPIMGMSDDEHLIYKKLQSNLLSYQKPNRIKQMYYEARQEINHLEIAVPRNLTDIGVAVGWAGTTVDAIDERIEFLGWVTDDDDLNGLDNVYVDNNLSVESNFSHVDSLTAGVSFVSVGIDEDAEDQVKVAVEGSSTATALWDYRKRRSLAGLSQTLDDDGNIIAETVYLQDANLFLMREDVNSPLELVGRNDHGFGRCFMTRLCNRSRPFQLEGRSEISRSVRYYTDAAVRTMLGMEVNREFYTAPQRFVLNAKPEDFGVNKDMSAEEKYRRGLSVAMGMINIIPPREDNTEGDPPSVVEFKPAPPTPFIEQVKAYSIQMSAETGLPATLFGFVTDNPTSGDAIVKSEFRLTRRSSRRISSFGLGWKETALLSMLARDGKADVDFLRRLRCRFANPMIPTPGATADETQKYIAAKVLVPDSIVTYERMGLDDRSVRQLERDKQKYEAKLLREAMQEQAMAAATAAQSQPGGGGPGTPSPKRKPAPSSAAP